MPVFQTGRDDQALLDWYNAATGGTISPPEPAVDPFYGAVDDWTSQRTTPSRSTGNQRPINDGVQAPAGYYPQPESYYNAPQRPVQGPAPRPEPPRPTYSVDPLEAAINTWRESNQSRLPASRYEVQQPQFDYQTERPDTGPSQFTAQQYKPPTVQSRTAPAYDPNAPEAPPSGLDAWLPSNYSFARPSVAPSVVLNAARDPQQQTAWGNVLSTAWTGLTDSYNNSRAGQVARDASVADGRPTPESEAMWQSWQDDYYNSAAYDRAQYNIDKTNQAYDEKYGVGGPGGQRTTFGDVVDVSKAVNAAEYQNRDAIVGAASDWWSGEKNLPDAIISGYEGLSFAPYFQQVAEVAKFATPFGAEIAPYTEGLGNKAMNFLSATTAPADYLYSNVDVPWSNVIPNTESVNNEPASVAIGAFVDLFQAGLYNVLEGPTSFAGEVEQDSTWTKLGDFFNSWVDAAEVYKQGTTATPEQEVTNTPEELRYFRQLANLNALGGSDASTKSFAYHADKNATIDELNTYADQQLKLGAATTDPDERVRYMTASAEAGAQAELMRTEHPQEANARFTNIGRQLLMEVLLPDFSDLAAGFFQAAELTPSLRRMNKAFFAADTPVEKVAAELAKMSIKDADTAVKVAAEVSSYNPYALWKLPSWFTIGTAKSHIATDRIRRVLVPILAEAETTADAKLLLYTMATEPEKLVSGMDGRLFQSSSILSRMDENGLVRFGVSGLEKDKEALRIFQQAAPALLESPTLKPTLLHRPDFLADYTDVMNGQGYRYYNVAADTSIPVDAVGTRIKTVKGNQGIVEYLDADGKVIHTSTQVPMTRARELKKSVASGGAEASRLGQIGQLQRSVVSLPYIILNPGTYVTNTLGGLATALGDGDFAVLTKAAIKDRAAKLYGGVSPTLRGDSLLNPASAESMYGKMDILRPLRKIYSGIDETLGGMVATHSGDVFLLKKGKPRLAEAISPLLEASGITDPAEIARINNHLFEVGFQGGDITAEFNKIVNGQTRVFSLADANESWIQAIPYDKQEELYNIVRTAANSEELAAKLDTWADTATDYWDNLLSSQKVTPQRYAWQKMGNANDVSDVARDGKLVTKYGDVPQADVDRVVKQVAEDTAATQAKLEELVNIATASADPKAKDMLYSIWAQAHEYTASVRVKLAHLVEEAGSAAAGSMEAKQGWQRYWKEAETLYAERNAKVSKLYDDANRGLATGANFTRSTNAMDTLERTARIKEDSLWKTLELEPQSGRYDARLELTIEAGRMISDKATARMMAAARAFPGVDAMDYIIMSETAVEIAGAQVRKYLDLYLERALKGKAEWTEYFAKRNEAWRQLRVYEKDMRAIAERSIVEDGLRAEAKAAPAAPAAATVAPLVEGEAPPANFYQQQRPDSLLPPETTRKVDDYLKQNAEAIPFDKDAEAVLDDTGVVAEAVEAAPRAAQAAPTVATPPVAVPRAQATPTSGVRGILQRGEDTIEGTIVSRDGQYYLRATDGVEIPANKRSLYIVDRNGQARSLDNVERLREVQGRVARDDSIVGGAKEARLEISKSWDRTAKAQHGLGRIDQVVASHIQKGTIVLPENFGEDLIGTVVAGRRIESTDDLQQILQEYYDLGQRSQGAAGRAVGQQQAYAQAWNEAVDLDELVQTVTEELNLGGVPRAQLQQAIAETNRMAEAIGGVVEGDVVQGAHFAKLQLQHIVDYIKENSESILRPTGRTANEALPTTPGLFRSSRATQGTVIPERSSLEAVNEFRRTAAPVWDNLKRGAAEYGDSMRSFSFIDFANQTRLDELMGVFVPYAFWATRSALNAAERAIFEPQIWRRVMQANQRVREVQEQNDQPQRYEGSVTLPWQNSYGEAQTIRVLPSKYWPTAGLFTSNDYASPESANSALGFADESLRAANLSTYPWFGAAAKMYEGKGDELYPMNYTPQTRMLAGWLLRTFGPDLPRILMPGYAENTTARALLNMVEKGTEIDGARLTAGEAELAMQTLLQKRTGEPDAPEMSLIDPQRLDKILRYAYDVAGRQDLTAAASVSMTSFSVKPFDEAEKTWLDEQGKYYNNAYGPDNQYGSYQAKQPYREAGMLTQAKAAVTNPDKRAPVEIYATEQKRAEKEATIQTLQQATDAFITSYDGTPANYEIDDFKDAWAAEQYGGKPTDYHIDTINAHLEEKYPSATSYDGEGQFTYDGYAPEEIRQKVRVAAYYKAREDLADLKPVYTEYPGDDAPRAAKAAWYKTNDQYKLDKVEYDKALTELTDQYLADPQVLRGLTGQYQLNPSNPGLVNDFARSLPKTLDDIYGYPVRPAGGDQFNGGLVDMAGDPANAEEIIKSEKEKNMSDLEKETRAKNEASGNKGSSKGYSSSYKPYRRYSRGGGYRRSGGGGGGAGGNYYVDPVYAREFPSWLLADPQYTGYRAPDRNPMQQVQIGPDPIKAWKPLSW